MNRNDDAVGMLADTSATVHIPVLPDPDVYFSMLSDACRDLDAPHGHLFQAQLALVLIHHIADLDIVREAIEMAKRGLNLPVFPTGEALPQG